MTTQRIFPPTAVPVEPYARPVLNGSNILRLDGNEGNQPSPDLITELSRLETTALREYPDTSALQSEIASWIGVDPEQVVVTAGADDALDRVCRAFVQRTSQIVLPIPTFEMLYRFAALTGGEVITVPWREQYPVDEVIDAIDSSTSLVVMVTPNNPTGRVASVEDLTRVARAAAGSIVLLDHAYVEYADEDLTPTALQFDNVVVVRTFSKAWGLAGCRVGYAVTSPEVAAVLRNAGNPYPVSSLSLAVARAQLRRGTGSLTKHVVRIKTERERLAAQLPRLGLSAAESQGNFLLVNFGGRAGFAYAALAFSGIAVRYFPHRPEISDALRISLPGNEARFKRLIAALELAVAPQALLFDMDGVLADVEASYRRCVVETARSFGLEITRKDLQEAIHAGDANNDWILTHRLLRHGGVDVSLGSVTAKYQELYLGAGSTGGLRERERLLISRTLLQRLAKRVKLGVVTGRPRSEAKWFLDRMGIRTLFDSIVCLEDAARKPDPAPVRLAVEQMEVERAWMLGDTPDDVRAASAAGVLPIGVVAPGDDTRAEASLEAAGAVTVLSSVAAVEDLLK